MTIKLTKSFITVDGNRAGIKIDKGPWNEFAKHPDQIKVRCKKGIFPNEVRKGLEVTNNSDSLTDYFEGDCLVLLPGHDLYETAKTL